MRPLFLDLTKIIVFFMILCGTSFDSISYAADVNIYLTRDNLNQIMRILIQEGNIKLSRGEFKKAADCYEIGLRIARVIEDNGAEAHCLMNLGLLCWNKGDLGKSLDFYQDAHNVAKLQDIGNLKQYCEKAIEIHHLYFEGKKLRSSGDYDKSIVSFEQAIKIAREIESEWHELKCLRLKSITYWNLFRYEEFYALNREALLLANQLNHTVEIGRCLNNIGLYYWKLNEFSKALVCYGEALDIFKKHNDKNSESDCLNNMGLIYRDLGDYEKALEYLNSAFEIDNNLLRVNEISQDFNNIGSTLMRQAFKINNDRGIFKSIDYFQQCLSLAKRTGNINVELRGLNNIANVFNKLKNYMEAKKYYTEALLRAKKVKDIEAEGMIQCNLGLTFYNNNDLKNSDLFYKKAIEIGNIIHSKQILWESYFGLGQCHERLKQFPLAIENYTKAIEIIENMRSQIYLDTDKAGFVRNKLKVYESLLDLLFYLKNHDLHEDYDRQIFELVEKAKASAFFEILRRSRTDFFARLSPKIREKEKAISDKITKLNQKLIKSDVDEKERREILSKINQAEDEYHIFISAMRDKTPEVANVLSPELYSFHQIQSSLLDSKTALVEYFIGEKQSYIFVITKDCFRILPLASKKELRKSLRAYLKLISQPPDSKFKGTRAAERIYNEIFSPVEAQIPLKINSLIIIPDGILYYLPFETLITKRSEKIATKCYLIEKYKISYAFSASSLLYLMRNRSDKNHPKTLLGIGDPAYRVENSYGKKKSKSFVRILKDVYQRQGFYFSPLPYSRKEIDMISSFFNNGKNDLYLGKSAREEMIKQIPLEKYRIIHFACHGLLDEEFPLRSAIVLSLDESKEEDGFLQVREIYNLRLSADLVVLSACHTGKGKLERGEGVLGLPRIFFYSGAKSVLTSIWMVGDKSASKFMKTFYSHLCGGNDLAEALRLSKLGMIKSKYSHPFYWAGFILTGDSTSKVFSHYN